jgi:hypothetical protein
VFRVVGLPTPTEREKSQMYAEPDRLSPEESGSCQIWT